MTIKTHSLTVSGIRVAVVRKAIKNLHLGVYPPDGHVRIAVPLAVSDAAVKVAIISKLKWIKERQTEFDKQARESKRELVSGESHFYLGRRYRLNVIETKRAGRIVLGDRDTLELHIRQGTDVAGRDMVLQRWYRERLRELVPVLLEKWQEQLDVEVKYWGIKRMKTRWGSCNPKARRIWLNLELVKKPPHCLEYIVVHELAHLIVRRHDDRFKTLLDQHLPKWRSVRKELNTSTLADEKWEF